MKAIYLILFFCITSVCNAQTAEEIINTYLRTVSFGDVTRWSHISTMYVESEVFYSQQQFDQRIDLLQVDKPGYSKKFVRLPDKKKVELYRDSAFLHKTSSFYVFNDKTIIDIESIPRMIKDAPKEKDIDRYGLPEFIAKLAERKKAAELLGVKEILTDGNTYYQIKIRNSGRDYWFYFNTDNFFT